MKTYEEMTDEVISKVKEKKAKRRGVVTRIVSLSLALVVSAGAILAAELTRKDDPVVPAGTTDTDKPGVPVIKGESILTAGSDYGEIFDLLSVTGYNNRTGFGLKGEAPDTAAAVEESEGWKNTSDLTAVENYGNADYAVEKPTEDDGSYSGTNVQVAGIDEADVVKTDGKYIYAVGGKSAFIISADKGEMEVLSTIPFTDEKGTAAGTDGALVTYETPDLYITDDRLVIVVRTYEHIEHDENGNELDKEGDVLPNYYYYYHSPRSSFSAVVYDISDRTSPVLVGSTSISGAGVSSRMTGGKLYLVASEYVHGEIDRDDPESYIPCVYRNGTSCLVAPDCIYYGGEAEECKYLNLMEIDLSDASETSSLSLLDYDGDIMYQSADNIYVAKTEYTYDSKTETEGDVTVETSNHSSGTVIAKISINGGLTLTGSARIEGYLHNSFSMDEYNGYLRVVTSVNNSEYVDKWRDVGDDTDDLLGSYGASDETGDLEYIDNIDYYDPYEGRVYFGSSWTNEMYNDLFILDSGMKVVGKLEKLAPDERVYSCRFEGDDGYFVTYRETDPLFHVDLSDPTAPRVVDELKIPGHSDYLQRFGDLLFGFGQNDEGELKLSMFREDATGAVTEIAKIEIPTSYYSDALYDHHAILADAERGIICFGAGSWGDDAGRTDYYVVRWNGQAFDTVAKLAIGSWPDAIRGLYIGDFFYLYVLGWDSINSITSYDFASFGEVDTVELDKMDYGDFWDITYDDYVVYE